MLPGPLREYPSILIDDPNATSKLTSAISQIAEVLSLEETTGGRKQAKLIDFVNTFRASLQEHHSSGTVHALTKLLYARILRLRRRVADAKPFYTQQIDRLDGKTTPVFDEVIYTVIQTFEQSQSDSEWHIRSSGVVDPRILHPWTDNLFFPDLAARNAESSVFQTISEPSSFYVVQTRTFNGLQEGHEDIGTLMNYDTNCARLVVDLSSLPSASRILKRTPKGVLRSGNKETPVGVIELAPNIYCAVQYNAKKNQALRMDLDIDWNEI
jgi:hypothetical protein